LVLSITFFLEPKTALALIPKIEDEDNHDHEDDNKKSREAYTPTGLMKGPIRI
jgi:hypothetical protein